MTKQEADYARAIYDAIKHKASGLNFIDKMVLMNALQNDTPFHQIPRAQQQHFLDVGMAGLKALKASSST